MVLAAACASEAPPPSSSVASPAAPAPDPAPVAPAPARTEAPVVWRICDDRGTDGRCTEWLAAFQARNSEADAQGLCGFMGGVFGEGRCPREGVTGSCVEAELINYYYGDNTTRAFGTRVRAAAICRGHGEWREGPPP